MPDEKIFLSFSAVNPYAMHIAQIPLSIKRLVLMLIFVSFSTSCFSAVDQNLPFVWHIRVDGDDRNEGHSYQTGLATISAAIEAATSNAGDVVYVWPGTYLESGVTIALDPNMTLCAPDGFKARIEQDINTVPTITLAAGARLKNLEIFHTNIIQASTTNRAVYAASANDLTIEKCYVRSDNGSALVTLNCDNLRLKDDIFKGAETAIWIGNNGRWRNSTNIESCQIEARNWNYCNSQALIGSSGVYNIKNSSIIDYAITPNGMAAGAYFDSTVPGTYTLVNIDNCIISAEHAADVNEKGLFLLGNVDALVSNSNIRTFHSLECYDIQIISQRLLNSTKPPSLVITGSKYDIAKTSGMVVEGGSGLAKTITHYSDPNDLLKAIYKNTIISIYNKTSAIIPTIKN
jgi:hypothetical protein